VVGSVTGAFPNPAYPLIPPDGVADLGEATFAAKIKGSGSFKWFDSAGVRHEASGDPDLVEANILADVDIFGTTGQLLPMTSPDPWDVRIGESVNGVAGKLQMNCRNATNPAIFDAGRFHTTIVVPATDTFTTVGHGFVNGDTIRFLSSGAAAGGITDMTVTYYVRNSTSDTFQVSTTSGGAIVDVTATGTNQFVFKWNDGARDVWDTVDDRNNDLGVLSAGDLPAGWNSDHYCGGRGVQTSNSVWLDVTSDGQCDSAGDQCVFRDKISGLEWTESQGGSISWSFAVGSCDILNFNGKSDWRLPDMKDLAGAQSHGIFSVLEPNWNLQTVLRGSFWTSTSYSMGISKAWAGNLASGTMFTSFKTGFYGIICVR
jgi:hypothetical protein